jgi:RNA polymerase sigma factor (sigma-70 family)
MYQNTAAYIALSDISKLRSVVLSMTTRHIKNHEDAEDITQEILIKLLKQRRKDVPLAYLAVAVRNMAADYGRQSKRASRVIDPCITLDSVTGACQSNRSGVGSDFHEPGGAQNAAQRRDNADVVDPLAQQADHAIAIEEAEHYGSVVRAVFDTLTDTLKPTVWLFGNGRQEREIAQILQIPVGTVKTRLFKARKKIQTLNPFVASREQMVVA